MQRHFFPALAALSLASCVGLDLDPPIAPAADVAVPIDEDHPLLQRVPPVVDTSEGSEWLLLYSGEWLRGELDLISRDIVEFDSEEMDDLKFDWEDVIEIVTTREFTVVLDDHTSLAGPIRVFADAVVVKTPDGPLRIDRERVFRVLPIGAGRTSVWEGELGFSGTWRSGNTDQADTIYRMSAVRRSLATRLKLDFESIFSEADKDKTADNQRFIGAFDWFLKPRFYVTPFGLDFYRDKFQNIDYQLTPNAGLGYTLVDSARTQWDVTGGAGYQFTEYRSGETDSDDWMTGRFGTIMDMDVTGDVDFILDFKAEKIFESGQGTNTDLVAALEVDLLWGLELDVRWVWNRVSDPEADSDGDRPDKNDYRVEVGVSWDF